jgi:hypothetical protein
MMAYGPHNLKLMIYQHHTLVSLKFGDLSKAIDWCKKTCYNEWAWTVSSSGGYSRETTYNFYFNEDKDKILFNMRFK